MMIPPWPASSSSGAAASRDAARHRRRTGLALYRLCQRPRATNRPCLGEPFRHGRNGRTALGQAAIVDQMRAAGLAPLRDGQHDPVPALGPIAVRQPHRIPRRQRLHRVAKRASRSHIAITCYARNSTCYDIETDLLRKFSSPDMHDNRWPPLWWIKSLK